MTNSNLCAHNIMAEIEKYLEILCLLESKMIGDDERKKALDSLKKISSKISNLILDINNIHIKGSALKFLFERVSKNAMILENEGKKNSDFCTE